MQMLFRYVIPAVVRIILNALVLYVDKKQLFLKFKMVECYCNLEGFQNSNKDYSEIPLTAT
jgi:hypothetical protein